MITAKQCFYKLQLVPTASYLRWLCTNCKWLWRSRKSCVLLVWWNKVIIALYRNASSNSRFGVLCNMEGL